MKQTGTVYVFECLTGIVNLKKKIHFTCVSDAAFKITMVCV